MHEWTSEILAESMMASLWHVKKKLQEEEFNAVKLLLKWVS
jgi:hypothetical protein